MDDLDKYIKTRKKRSSKFAKNFDKGYEQFKIGVSNSIDVMDANTLLVKAERELSDAIYQYKISELNLQRTKGSLLKNLGIMGK